MWNCSPYVFRISPTQFIRPVPPPSHRPVNRIGMSFTQSFAGTAYRVSAPWVSFTSFPLVSTFTQSPSLINPRSKSLVALSTHSTRLLNLWDSPCFAIVTRSKYQNTFGILNLLAKLISFHLWTSRKSQSLARVLTDKTPSLILVTSCPRVCRA